MSAALSVLAGAPVVLAGLPLRVDRDDVLRFQGYRAGRDVPPAEVWDLFDEAVALGERLMEPRVVYRALPAAVQGADDIEAAGERLHIPGIGRLWGRLSHVGAGICTVGQPLEDEVGRLFAARELPLAVMLDGVGSAAVDGLAEHANDLLCQAAHPGGLAVTSRISPGHTGWDAAEQRALFRLCPGEPIGVGLNEACFMAPVKSISFLVGIGPEARGERRVTQCRRCWMRDCAYRRVPAGAMAPR